MPNEPRIKLPEHVTAGEVIEIKTLVRHVMETGNRKAPDGTVIPRNIIHTFRASFDGKTVFTANWGPGIAANPYIAFTLKVPGPGTLQFTWITDTGETVVETTALNIS